jgi:hypothetical protein
MKAEFAEYRTQQLEEKQKLKEDLKKSEHESPPHSKSPPPLTTRLPTSARTTSPHIKEDITAGASPSERLESII